MGRENYFNIAGPRGEIDPLQSRQLRDTIQYIAKNGAIALSKNRDQMITTYLNVPCGLCSGTHTAYLQRGEFKLFFNIQLWEVECNGVRETGYLISEASGPTFDVVFPTEPKIFI